VCGILGVFDNGGHLPPPERFTACMDRLQRRGPDDAGTWSNSVLRLGHRRLAVVDLSPTGHQPMVSADGRFVIVFNGEIYNHAELRPQLAPPAGWQGSSDTETLLESYRQWGSGCVAHLNGMFAFAIWDNLERRLFLARDRMGVKPLYYSWSDGRFVFASRPSGLVPLHKAKLLAGALEPSTRVGIFNYLRSLAKDFSPLLAQEVLQGTGSSNDWFETAALGFAPSLTSAEVGMRLDLGLTLVDGYLQKVDVASMAVSLEARCPLIDYRLIEWSMRLPVEFKLRGRHTKYLLKKALCRYLPPNLVHRPKQGFGVPVGQWLRGPLYQWAQELLYDESLVSRLPLDKSRLRALFKLHMSGARDAHPLLWAALMLLCYVARHDRSMGLPPVATQRAA
jgi:asparagine synthetase B (glutamine-hydrolysing)